MKKIHKYITKNFLMTFIISLIFVSMLFVLSDFFGNLSNILKNSVSIKYIVEYYLYFIPFIVYLSLPFVFGLSSLISLGFLSMKNEIIVMRSSGLSIFNISKPILILSILTAIIMFLGKEEFVNYGLQRASFIKHYYFNDKQLEIKWIKAGSYFIYIPSINVNNKTATNIIAYKVDKNFSKVEKILECSSMKIKDKEIVLKLCRSTSKPFEKYKLKKKEIIPFKGNFYSLLSLSKLKEPSIKTLIKEAKNAKNKNYYISTIMFRILYPVSCLVLALISLVFVLKITPRKSGFIKNVFIGGVLFLVYIGSFEMINSMGKYSMLNPIISMIIFILFWISISLYNLLKLGI